MYDIELDIDELRDSHSPMNIHNRIWVENVWCVNSMLQIIHRCRNILLFANMTMWLVVIVQSDSKIKALLISSFWGWPGKNTNLKYFQIPIKHVEFNILDGHILQYECCSCSSRKQLSAGLDKLLIYMYTIDLSFSVPICESKILFPERKNSHNK